MSEIDMIQHVLGPRRGKTTTAIALVKGYTHLGLRAVYAHPSRNVALTVAKNHGVPTMCEREVVSRASGFDVIAIDDFEGWDSDVIALIVGRKQMLLDDHRLTLHIFQNEGVAHHVGAMGPPTPTP